MKYRIEKKNEKKPQTTTTIGENRSITNQHMRAAIKTRRRIEPTNL